MIFSSASDTQSIFSSVVSHDRNISGSALQSFIALVQVGAPVNCEPSGELLQLEKFLPPGPSVTPDMVTNPQHCHKHWRMMITMSLTIGHSGSSGCFLLGDV